jgi:hypothetical protein
VVADRSIGVHEDSAAGSAVTSTSFISTVPVIPVPGGPETDSSMDSSRSGEMRREPAAEP